MTHRAGAVLVALTVIGVTACGVNSQDRPRPIEHTSILQAPTLPTVATRPRYTPTSPIPATSSAAATGPPPSPSDPPMTSP